MSDYNKRQYRLMLNQLDSFGTRIDLKHLINGLESLLASLEEPVQTWKAAFQQQWGILEDVYADALDRRLTELPDAHKKLLADAVANLKALVEEALDGEEDGEGKTVKSKN